MTRQLSMIGVVMLVVMQQTPTPPLVASEPFRVPFDHVVGYYNDQTMQPCTPPASGCVSDTTSYSLQIDGVSVQTVPAPMAPLEFVVASGLPSGTHNVQVWVNGPGGSNSAPIIPLPIANAVSPPGSQGTPTISRSTPPPPAQCADGLDNDKDGLIDLADPGCANAADNDETNTPPPPSLTITVATPWAQAANGNVTTQATTTVAGELLIAAIAADTGGAAPTITLTSSPTLTWTQRIASGGSNTSQVRFYTTVATGASTTATIAVTGSSARAVQLYRVAGYNASQPIGATWSGTSSTNNWTANTYTSTISGSVGIALAADWAALGAPSSTDLGQPSHLQVSGTSLSWIAVRKAAATPNIGTTVTFNFDAAGAAGPTWRGVAMEVRPQ